MPFAPLSIYNSLNTVEYIYSITEHFGIPEG